MIKDPIYATMRADRHRGMLGEVPNPTKTKRGDFKHVVLCNYELGSESYTQSKTLSFGFSWNSCASLCSEHSRARILLLSKFRRWGGERTFPMYLSGNRDSVFTEMSWFPRLPFLSLKPVLFQQTLSCDPHSWRQRFSTRNEVIHVSTSLWQEQFTHLRINPYTQYYVSFIMDTVVSWSSTRVHVPAKTKRSEVH